MLGISKCFGCVLASHLHDLVHTTWMFLEIVSHVQDFSLENNPATFLRFMQGNLAQRNGVCPLRQCFFLCLHFRIFLFFGNPIEISLWRFRGLNSSNEPCIPQADCIIRMWHVIERAGAISSTEPKNLLNSYLTRMSSPPGCSTKKSFTLYTLYSTITQQS